jgi:hypothetical protein
MAKADEIGDIACRIPDPHPEVMTANPPSTSPRRVIFSIVICTCPNQSTHSRPP